MNISAFALRQKVKKLSQNVYLPAVYGLAKGQKADPDLVVFADAHHNARPAAMDLLYHRLKKDGRFHIVQTYCDYGTASKKKVFQHMTVFMRLYAKAGFVIICDNFLPVASCRKKPGTKVIQLWHACGCCKKFGYDAPDDIPADYHGEVFRNIDLVTVSSRAAVQPFCGAMHLTDEQVRPLGVSRTDLYFSDRWKAHCIRNFREKYPEVYEETEGTENRTMMRAEAMGAHEAGICCDAKSAKAGSAQQAEAVKTQQAGAGDVQRAGARKAQEAETGKVQSEEFLETPEKRKKVVLWAPTFRGNAGVPELVNLDVDRLQRELGEDYLVLTRLHPHMKKEQKDSAHDCPIPTEELYPVVDVLIADYSSLIYEYLLLGGQVVLYAPDVEAYRKRRGFYMDIDEIPGQLVTDPAKLAEAVRQAAKAQGGDTDYAGQQVSDSDYGRKAARHGKMIRGDGSFASSERKMNHGDGSFDSSGEKAGGSARLQFLAKYMSACDGHATERIVRWMSRHYGA